jgi:hypothetical protein
MASFQQTRQTGCSHDLRSGKRSRHLSSTMEKLARAGEQPGFRVEEMIEMLNAGVSIGSIARHDQLFLVSRSARIYTAAAGGVHR